MKLTLLGAPGAGKGTQSDILSRKLGVPTISTDLTETLGDVTAHAEMQAITMAANQLGGKYLTDCTLYVTVEPCIMCAGAIGWSQIRRVVFGAADEKRGFMVYAPKALHPKCTVTQGVLEEECRTLMTEFFRSRRS